MELASYVRMLRKRWASILLITACGLAVSLGASLVATPVYSAGSQVFVSVQGSDSTTDLLQGSNFTVRQVKSYTELVDSPRVLQPVVEELGLAVDASELAERVTARSPLDTVLINISADSESPQLAAEIADATAASLARVVAELETPRAGGESPVVISTVRPADVPIEPASPDVPVNLALGLLAGLGAGTVVAVLRELLDTRIRTLEDVEASVDASVIGVIRHEPGATKHPLIVQEPPQSIRAEAFRRLRTNLQFVAVEDDVNTIVLTSALPGEGKSTTAVNLAIALADAGQRVVLVDADLRRPSIAAYTGVERSVGLTTVLIGRAGLDDVVQPWGNGNLDVIAAGQVPPNPSELLGSTKMAALMEELAARYDTVLVDTPPLLPVTDGAILARLLGGAVVVVGAGTIHKPQLKDALDMLSTVSARVRGLVVNRVPVRDGGGYGYSYEEYTSADPTVHSMRRRRKRAASGVRSARSGGSGRQDGRRRPVHAGAAARVPAGERSPDGARTAPFPPPSSDRTQKHVSPPVRFPPVRSGSDDGFDA